MSIDEDYYIPVRAGQSSRIETLAGGAFTGDIDDVNYLRDKLFSALKIPKAYLAQADTAEDKTTLAQKDIRFARTIQRLQRVVIAELEKMCIIHLFTLGYRDNDLTNFRLTLNNPSKIAELQELEHMRTKFEIAGAATEGFFSRRWVYKNIFKLDDDEIERMMFEQYTDSKHASMIEAAGTAVGEAAGQAMTAGLGGGEGDEGDLGLGGEELGGEEAGGEEEGEEGPLLAEPPGQRDDWYVPVALDGRRSGAMNRHMQSLGGKNGGYPGPERLFTGVAGELGPLARGITGEVMEREERLITETNFEIKKLISDLEKKYEGETQ